MLCLKQKNPYEVIVENSSLLRKENPMDSQRQGEIAIKLLKYLLRQKGVNLSSLEKIRGEAEEVSEMIGIPATELLEFAKPLVQELVDECFAPEPGMPLGEAFAAKKKQGVSTDAFANETSV